MPSTTSIGRQAEQAATNYLLRLGLHCIARNWRTRWCEIDIIARRGETIHFIEVKYRASLDWGSGLEYITSKKLQQMEFAASLWAGSQDWRGEYCLGAIEVCGPAFEVTNYVEDVSK